MRAHRPLSLLLAILFAGSAAAPAGAEGSAAEPATPVERVARLCEAWTAAEYLHPWLAYRDVDWDAAFVEAAPAAWEAEDRAAYRAAAERMLSALGDPATGLIEESPDAETGRPEPGAGDEPPPLVEWLEPEPGRKVLLVDLAGYARTAGNYSLYGALRRELAPEIESAAALIVDLRYGPPEGPGGAGDPGWVHSALDGVIGGLVARETVGATERWLVHWGYRSDTGVGSNAYRTAFASSLASVYTPSDPDAPARSVVFLVDESTPLPDSALALLAAGNGSLVSVAPLGESLWGDSETVDLGEGLSARVRVTERVAPWGGPLRADAVVGRAADGTDPALDAALAIVARGGSDGAGPVTRPDPAPAPALRWRPAPSYPDRTVPDLGHRLLAGCRAWGVIRHFYPYLHLLDDWDGAFRASLPELAAGSTDGQGEAAYARAVMRLMAHVEDGHTNLWGHPGIARVRGDLPLPIGLRELGGEIVVTDIARQEVEGVEVGDVLVAVDGVPIEERIEALLPVVTASRPLTRRLAAARWGAAGSEGSVAVLTLRGADGETREVEVTRSWEGTPVEAPETAPWRTLEPTETGLDGAAIGYVDLTELEAGQVETVMRDLAGTDAIVFDLRGYPKGTAWPLAPHLNVHGAEDWATFRRREVSHEGFGSFREQGYSFIQRIPQRPEGAIEPYRPYQGRVVVLIDERAISQSEHTALMLQETADALFVGTATAGANGDVTSFALPGGLNVLFTGHDVRHADGSQLQRVGVLPDLEVAPTPAGLRAGRDEVLEAALAHLRAELAD